MSYSSSIKYLSVTACSVFLSGCFSTAPILGGGSGDTISGAAAGANSTEKGDLESCKKPLGTVSLFEDHTRPWWNYYNRHYHKKLGSTIPVIRMMVQKSNCFVVVERGAAMKAMSRERALMNSGELRGSSNMGQGQMVAADYTLSPEVTFEESSMGKITGAARRWLPGSSWLSGSVGAKSNDATTTLLMIDNRSGVQVSSSIGNAKNFDLSFSGYSWSRGGFGGASGFAKSAAGKVIMASFVDSYNQMVKALRNYKPQKVKGGLGTGGALEVDGQTKAKPTKKKVTKTSLASVSTVSVSRNSQVNVNRGRSHNVSVDEYDPNALNDYYKALKKAVKNLSNFANMGPDQIKAIGQYNNTGINLWTLMWSSGFSGEFETSKIELESWPLDARQKGWRILGRKISKYNKLFYKHRKSILANKATTDDVKSKLKAVELVTEKSLFEG